MFCLTTSVIKCTSFFPAHHLIGLQPQRPLLGMVVDRREGAEVRIIGGLPAVNYRAEVGEGPLSCPHVMAACGYIRSPLLKGEPVGNDGRSFVINMSYRRASARGLGGEGMCHLLKERKIVLPVQKVKPFDQIEAQGLESEKIYNLCIDPLTTICHITCIFLENLFCCCCFVFVFV